MPDSDADTGLTQAQAVSDEAVPHRIAEIEALRGIAVIMVLIQHGAFMYPWNTRLGYYTVLYWHGSAGVDLFFAISGFVIARTLLPELARLADLAAALPALRRFLLRRFWRLQPSAWVWVLIPLPFSAFFNRSGIFQSVQANIGCGIAGLLGFANLRLGGFNYGAKNSGLDSHYWSLSLEEQFYLFLPLAALLLRRRLAWLMLAVLAYQFALPWQPVYNMTRPGGLAVGVLLAIWSRHPAYAVTRPTFLGRGAMTRFVFLAVLIYSVGALESWLPYPLFSVPYGLMAVLCGVLVYAASFDCGYIMRSGPQQRFLLWCGSRSYAIYLSHMTAFALVRELYFRLKTTPFVVAGMLHFEYAAVAIVLTAVMSELSYRLVELPCLAHGRALRARWHTGRIAHEEAGLA